MSLGTSPPRITGRKPPDRRERRSLDKSGALQAHRSSSVDQADDSGDELGVTIHRSEHAQRYTVIPNEAAQNTSLSLTARGLLLELLSRPPTWRISPDELARHEPESRERVRKALRELRDAGYAVLTSGRDGHGQSWSRWEIFDVPQR